MPPLASEQPESVVDLDLSAIKDDREVSCRAGVDHDTALSYAQAFKDGDQLPPVVVFWDGKTYWLADGFHRYCAAMGLRLPKLKAIVKSGTRRDAMLYAAGANATHGLRRTNDEKRKAVRRLLEDSDWSGWSENRIAKHCHVSNHLVAEVKAQIGILQDNPSGDQDRVTVQRGDSKYPMNTSNVGKGTKGPSGMAPKTPAPMKGGLRQFERVQKGYIGLTAEYRRQFREWVNNRVD
jgi:hypothetical protein